MAAPNLLLDESPPSDRSRITVHREQYPRSRKVRFLRTVLGRCWPWLCSGYFSLVLGNFLTLWASGSPFNRDIFLRALLLERLLPFIGNQPEVGWSIIVATVGLTGLGLWANHDAQKERHAIAERKFEEMAAKSHIEISVGYDDLGPPEHFVGRQVELSRVLRRLLQGGIVGISAVHGLAGIGKTALAAVVIARLREDRRFADGIVVVKCERRLDAWDILSDVLSRFHQEGPLQKDVDLPALSRLAHGTFAGKRVLVVLDNVEPELDILAVVRPLRDAGVALLITSRHTLPLTVVPPEGNCALDLLSPEESLDLFAHTLSSRSLEPQERVAAEQIVKQLGQHTLAVKLAGAYANEGGRDLAELSKELSADPLHGTSNSLQPVRLAFARSTESLPYDARKLLVALTLFPTREFGRKAALAVGEALRLEHPAEVIDLLVRRALLDAFLVRNLPTGSDRERLKLHTLLREYAQTGLGEESHLDPGQAFEARLAICRYYAAYGNQHKDEARVLRYDDPNMTGALQWIHDHMLYEANKLQKSKSSQDRLSKGNHTFGMWRHNQVEHLETLYESNELIAAICDGLAYYWFLGGQGSLVAQYLDWGEFAATACARRSKNQADWYRASRLAHNLGQVLEKMENNSDKAENAYERSLDIRRDTGDTSGIALTTMALGRIQKERGNFAIADAYLTEALEIMRKPTVANQYGECQCLKEMGDLARDWKRSSLARERYGEALRIAERLSSKGSLQAKHLKAVVLCSLGNYHLHSGRPDEAEQQFNECLDILRDVGDNQSVDKVLYWLGLVCEKRDHHEGAVRYYQEAFALAQTMKHLTTGQVVSTALNRLEARAKIRQAKPIGAMEHIKIRRANVDLFIDAGKQAVQDGALDEAVKNYSSAKVLLAEIRDRKLEMAVNLQLGLLAQQRKSFDEAEDLYQQALVIACSPDVRDQDTTAIIKHHLKVIAKNRGELDPPKAQREATAMLDTPIPITTRDEDFYLYG